MGGGYLGGGMDAFVSKFDPSGAELWTRPMGGINTDWGTGMAVDAYDNLYITGDSTSGFGGSRIGSSDAFLTKRDSDGNEIWTRRIGSAARDLGTSIAVTASGDIYFGGYTQGDIDGTSHGGGEAFLSKFSSAGTELWTEQYGTVGNDGVHDLVLDAAGNAYVTGTTGHYVGNIGGDLGGPGHGHSARGAEGCRSTSGGSRRRGLGRLRLGIRAVL